MTMYAMGDAKYARSSFWAIARTLRMIRLLDAFLGRQREEDLLEAHAHRPELEQTPSAADDHTCQLAPHVVSLVAGDLERAFAAGLGGRNADDAGHSFQRGSRLRHAFAIDVHEHRFRAAEPVRQVLRRVHGHHLALVDDDDALTGL